MGTDEEGKWADAVNARADGDEDQDAALFDRWGYPSEETLGRIRGAEWPEDAFALAREAWNDTYGRWTECAEGRVEVATGGWSGNEEVIEALLGHKLFWVMFWESSRRGGLFVFRGEGKALWSDRRGCGRPESCGMLPKEEEAAEQERMRGGHA